MPVACSHCGQMLPRDDAHFCNSCGMLVPSHPFSPQSLMAPDSSLAPSAEERKKTSLREQVAHQPFSDPGPDEHHARASEQRDSDNATAREKGERRAATHQAAAPKSWVRPLDTPPQEEESPIPSWPKPVTHISIADQLANQREAASFPPARLPDTEPPQEASPALDQKQAFAGDHDASNEAPGWENMPEGDIEAQPTRHMPVPSEKEKSAAEDIEEQPTQHMSTFSDQQAGDVASLDTSLMPAVPNEPAATASSHGLEQRHEPEQRYPAWPPSRPESSLAGLPDLPALPEPPVSGTPSFSGVPVDAQPTIGQPLAKATDVTPPGAPSAWTPPRPRSRRPLVLVSLILLFLVLVGGTVTWIYMVRPFSIPDITQPQVNFKDSSLGWTLDYPNGWTAQVDRAKSTVHFFDSSHTAMLDVALNDSAGQSVDQYVQQLVKQRGMTGVQPGSQVSFGGANWTRTQGTVVLSGASYTCAIFATTHGNHIVTLTQYAPQSTYNDSEQLIFQAIRASFHFL